MRALSLVALTGCVTGLHPTGAKIDQPGSATAQPFALPDSDGHTVSLAGPTVLVFYRGHW
jgi:hypothetical protein